MNDTNITSHSNETERRIVPPIGRRLRIVEVAPHLIDEAIAAQQSQDRAVVPGLFSPGVVGKEITTELQTPPVEAARHQGALAVVSGMVSATEEEKRIAEARAAVASSVNSGDNNVHIGQIAA